VFRGAGLFDLCKAAAFFRTEFEIEIDVYGLMLQGSLPWLTTKITQSYSRQANTIWATQTPIRDRLPDFAHLIIGDVKETIQEFY